MAAALEGLSAGTPPPTIRKAMVEARVWAKEAASDELRAYAAACLDAMSPDVRIDFIVYVGARFPELNRAGFPGGRLL